MTTVTSRELSPTSINLTRILKSPIAEGSALPSADQRSSVFAYFEGSFDEARETSSTLNGFFVVSRRRIRSAGPLAGPYSKAAITLGSVLVSEGLALDHESSTAT